MTQAQTSSLNLLATMACDGLNFFRFAQHHTDDPEIANAFRVAANVRELLLLDLIDADIVVDPAIEQPTTLDDSALSYRPLRMNFDGTRPERIALELYRREQAMRLLVESVFRERPEFTVRKLMKAFLPAVQRDVDMWLRLAHRAAIAA